MFNLLRLFFTKKHNELEESLVEETIKMLGHLSELKSKGQITEAVYKVEIEKKLAVLKSLNSTYQKILEGNKEAAASDERKNH